MLPINGNPAHPRLDWTHAVLEAMKKEPRDFGYARMEWNAPLLSQYLEKHHGQSIPSNRIRDALKESGYEWHVTRYRKAHR
jgi:transposase